MNNVLMRNPCSVMSYSWRGVKFASKADMVRSMEIVQMGDPDDKCEDCGGTLSTQFPHVCDPPLRKLSININVAQLQDNSPSAIKGRKLLIQIANTLADQELEGDGPFDLLGFTSDQHYHPLEDLIGDLPMHCSECAILMPKHAAEEAKIYGGPFPSEIGHEDCSKLRLCKCGDYFEIGLGDGPVDETEAKDWALECPGHKM